MSANRRMDKQIILTEQTTTQQRINAERHKINASQNTE